VTSCTDYSGAQRKSSRDKEMRPNGFFSLGASVCARCTRGDLPCGGFKKGMDQFLRRSGDTWRSRGARWNSAFSRSFPVRRLNAGLELI
jgi:hypothetical protein